MEDASGTPHCTRNVGLGLWSVCKIDVRMIRSITGSETAAGIDRIADRSSEAGSGFFSAALEMAASFKLNQNEAPCEVPEYNSVGSTVSPRDILKKQNISEVEIQACLAARRKSDILTTLWKCRRIERHLDPESLKSFDFEWDASWKRRAGLLAALGVLGGLTLRGRR